MEKKTIVFSICLDFNSIPSATKSTLVNRSGKHNRNKISRKYNTISNINKFSLKGKITCGY